MHFLRWLFIAVFSLTQGAAPLVHAHPIAQGQGFHFHLNTSHVFQISQGKPSESPSIPILAELKLLPALAWPPSPPASTFHPPIEAISSNLLLFFLATLFARAPPVL